MLFTAVRLLCPGSIMTWWLIRGFHPTQRTQRIRNVHKKVRKKLRNKRSEPNERKKTTQQT